MNQCCSLLFLALPHLPLQNPTKGLLSSFGKRCLISFLMQKERGMWGRPICLSSGPWHIRILFINKTSIEEMTYVVVMYYWILFLNLASFQIESDASHDPEASICVIQATLLAGGKWSPPMVSALVTVLCLLITNLICVIPGM